MKLTLKLRITFWLWERITRKLAKMGGGKLYMTSFVEGIEYKRFKN